MRRILPFILLSSVVTTAFFVGTNPGLAKLKSEVDKLKKDPDLSHGVFGIYVLDIKKDSVLVDYNGSMGLVPASSQKTLTTAAALCILGENYKFETKLEYDGTLDSVKGVLKGNLYIHGSGDPSLDSKYFKKEGDSSSIVVKWAKWLAAKGIKKIEGAVIADASVFEDEMTPSTWIWGDMGNYYGAGACGLTYRDNSYTVYFKTNGAGDSAKIKRTDPYIPGMNIINYVKAGGSSDNCFIYGAPYSDSRYATGMVPPNQSEFDVNGSMPDPSWFCAWSLDSALTISGISVIQKPTTVRSLKLAKQYKPASRKLLYTEYSPPLSQIVYWCNRRSINLYAECLLKAISVKQKGYGGEDAGDDALTEYWQGKGMSTGGMHLNDGCGLSRWNSVTCKQFATLMKLMSKESCYKTFYTSLPVQSTAVSAKSGYINRVRSYTGYATKKNGDLIAFAIIANNYDCTAPQMRIKLEKVMDAISEVE
jgi:D-alanyl-D-alanine carboxypeptidase/D-alanyl-D-alanine-endopeptidase (penicillin-binding protein 4)